MIVQQKSSPSIPHSVAVGLLACFLSLPLIGFSFSFDQGVFAAIAHAMLKGGIAYKDCWEHKPPGIFFVYYLAFLSIEKDILAVRLFELVAIGLSAVGLLHVVSRNCGSLIAGTIAGLMMSPVYLSFGQNTAQPETFQIPCIIAALLIWPNSEDKAGAMGRCFLAGMVAALGVLFKTPFIAVLLFFLIERLYWDRLEAGIIRKARFALVTLCGMCIPCIIVFSYYLARGAGWDLVDALIIFPLEYAAWGHRQQPIWSHLAGSIEWASTLLNPFSLSFIFIGILRALEIRTRETLRWAAFSVACLASVIIQGRYFLYHYIPLVPAIAWGSGLIFSKQNKSCDPTCERLLASYWSKAMIVILAGLMICHEVWTKREYIHLPLRAASFRGAEDDSNARDQQLCADLVKKITTPRDGILVFGDMPLLYVLSDRSISGGRCHLMQIMPAWDSGIRVERLLDKVKRDPPRAIVVTPGALWWRDNHTAHELLEDSPPIMEFLKSSYSSSEAPAGFEVWVYDFSKRPTLSVPAGYPK